MHQVPGAHPDGNLLDAPSSEPASGAVRRGPMDDDRDSSVTAEVSDGHGPASVPESIFVKAGRADVARIRDRTLRIRLARAIVLVGLVTFYLSSKALQGKSALPGLPPGAEFWLPRSCCSWQ